MIASYPATGLETASRTSQRLRTIPLPEATIRIESLEVERPDIFYREAGKSEHPKRAFFHGFPVSSHQDRHLIPALGGKFAVLAVKHIASNVIRFHDEHVAGR